MQNDTELKELFDRMFTYKDGHIEWQHPVKAMKNPAGRVNLRGYRYVNVNYKSYLVHRVIFLMHHGYLPKYVDHIDGNKTNNKIENLREATHSQNILNSKRSSRNKSGVKGVFWCDKRKRYLAKFEMNNKWYWAGSFKNIEDADLALRKLREKHQGEFARHE